ncbi:MAG TPA: 50S ribosomal protein L9 [Verrucomicrobiota bacterium]|nr:50S ribosomal protein L9 [Verrucomicrobiota bacterium]HNU49616.1 50S ribosomal protein L9 [Verrucomicrobiota bacterium]
MAKTEVILTSNIVGLGAESDQVKVAAGYARNFLIPNGLAIPLSATNKRRLEVLRQRRAEREAHELNTMSELAASLSRIVLKITVKTGADGKMFGAVTAGTIADELKHQCDVTLDRRKIHLDQPIRTLDTYEVDLRLHADVHAKLKVVVQAAAPAEVPEAAPGAEGKPAAPAADGKPARAPRERSAAPREGRPSRSRAERPKA